MDACIDVVELRKHVNVGFLGRRKDLLHGLTFRVPKGAIFGFVGPNGAGKSTTIKTLIGAAKPSSGTVKVLGGSSHDLAVRRRLGYLPELPQLPLTLTPDELMFLHGHLAGMERTKFERRREQMLERVGLLERRGDRLSTFSKGMQQRIAIALAVVHEPDLVILDEPMSGLDPLGRRLVRELIVEQKARGAAVFFSSHILPDVEALCDDIAIVNKGRLIAAGSVREVLAAEGVSVDVTVRCDEAVRAALAAKFTVSPRGDFALVKLAGDVDLVATLTELTRAGAVVVGVETVRPHLEEQLVKLLERASPDGRVGAEAA